MRVLLCLLFSVSVASAQTVTSASGAFTHGSSNSLGGSSLGTKPTAYPVKWEDVTSCTLGGALTTCSDPGPTWTVDSPLAPHPPIVSTATLRPGTPYTQNWRSQINGAELSPQGASFNYLTVPSFTKIYINAWGYLDTSGRTGTIGNNKLFRITQTNAQASNNDPAIAGDPTSFLSDWTLQVDFNAGNDGHSQFFNAGPNLSSTRISNQWVHVEYMVDCGSCAAATDGLGLVNINEVTRYALSSIAMIGTGQTGWQEVYWGGYANDNAGAWTGNYYENWDSIYFDTSFLRVVVCDTATYAARTHCEIQIPTAWSSTAITFTANRGSFATLVGAYAYVCTAPATCSTNGFQLSADDATGPVRLRLTGLLFAGLLPIFWRRRHV